MSSTQMLVPPHRKRNHADAGLNTDSTSELQLPKRFKLHSADFYNSLTEVWLTRRALKELDRRTSQFNSPQRPAAARLEISREDTWKQLKRFARHGGPGFGDIRGHPAQITVSRNVSSSHSSCSRKTKSTAPTSTSSKSRRSSAYDNNFEHHLNNHHIYVRNRKSKPNDLEEVQQRLSQPRPSLSPSRFTEAEFESFQQANEEVIDEGKVIRDVVPIIVGNSDIPSKQNLLFTRLDPITNAIVNTKPDFYDGARPGDVDKRVQDDIGNYIIPTGHLTAPVAPNFFLEVKRPSGGADVAKRQACYNGDLGARGMHQLQSYGQDGAIYDGNAYTLTSTYHAGTLRMYTTHLTQPGPGRSPEYHMSQIGGWDTLGDLDTCRRGFAAFRNARDLAQEQRDTFISAANERVLTRNMNSAPPASSPDAAAFDSAVNDAQYYTSQTALEDEARGCLPMDSSTHESSEVYDRSDQKDAYPAQEAESSPDELALEERLPEPPSNERRHRSSRRTFFKVPRYADGKT